MEQLHNSDLANQNNPMVQSICMNLENGIAQTQVSSTNTLTLTVKQASKLLQISLPLMYELVAQPEFPSFRFGNKYYISRTGLEQWIERQCTNKMEVS